jgi:lipase chaperone LimK
MQKNKLITIIIGVIILNIIAYNIFKKNSTDKQNYIFDKNSNVKLEDIKITHKKIDFNKENTNNFFTDKIANSYTLKYFKFLGKKFEKTNTIEEHLAAVKEYLYSILPPDEAEALFALYKKHFNFTIDLSKKLNEWGLPKNGKSMLEYLKKIQAERRRVFGQETADILYGAEIKYKEYPIRRKMIVSNNDLYGAEKEKLIDNLNKDMWGDEADKVENINNPLTKYQEKLKIYDKDFSEANDSEKIELRNKIRNDQIERLEVVDQTIADEKIRDVTYKSKESDILNNSNLDQTEKNKQIDVLQKEMYGNDTEAFKRRKNIEDALKKRMDNY